MQTFPPLFTYVYLFLFLYHGTFQALLDVKRKSSYAWYINVCIVRMVLTNHIS